MCLMKNFMNAMDKYYGGIICCPGAEIRKRTLVWEPPLLVSPLAAIEFFSFPFSLSLI